MDVVNGFSGEPMGADGDVVDSFDSEVMAKRSNVVREVIQTEANYYESLKVVKEAFIDALFNRKSPETSVLTRQECQVVFINWRDLYINSNRLSKALIIRQRNAANQHDFNIGDILCEHVSYLWRSEQNTGEVASITFSSIVVVCRYSVYNY